MTPPQIKEYAETCDCEACREITRQDLYVNHKSKDGEDWREIRVRFGPKPCQCGCGKPVVVGQRARQKTGVGVCHPGHEERL